MTRNYILCGQAGATDTGHEKLKQRKQKRNNSSGNTNDDCVTNVTQVRTDDSTVTKLIN